MSDEDLKEFLGSVEFFSAFSDAETDKLIASAEHREFGFGEPVFDAGDEGDGVFVVRSGAVRIFTLDGGKEINMGIRKEGEVFAELAALRGVQHEAAVRASAKTELLFFPREVMAQTLRQNEEARQFVASYVAIASAGGFVAQLFNLRRKVKKEEIEEYVRSVGIKRVAEGSTILEQGDVEDRRLYVIRQGKVRLLANEGNVEYPLGTIGAGELLGEKACLLREGQRLTAVAETDVVLLVVPEKTVHTILAKNDKLKEVLGERIAYVDREVERQQSVAAQRKRPLQIDLSSRAKRGENVIRRFGLVQQAEEMDCGAACLAMVTKHHGINMTLGKLREMANVTREGATLESLARVGETLGFATRGVRCTFDALLGFDMPFIAHWQGYHFVVVYGISKNHVWVADPGPGFKKYTREEFETGWTGNCMTFTASDQLAQVGEVRSPWLRFIGYVAPYKEILGHLFLATFMIQILGVAPPVIIQNILDQVIVHANVSLLNVLIMGLVITMVFTQVTSVLRSYLSTFMVRNLDFQMMSGFLKHAMSLPLSFFAKRKTGDVFARFQENQTIRAFLTNSTISTVLNLLMVFIYVTVLMLYSVTMTMLLLGMVIPILVLTVAVTPKIKAFARESFTASTAAESTLMEIIGGAETVKGMGLERSMRIKWENEYATALDVQYRAARFNILVGLGSQVLNSAITVAVLWLGASLVMAQELSIGQLIAFNALMGSVLSPLLGLVGLWNQVHQAGVAMERLGDILEMEPEQRPDEAASRVVLPNLQSNIELKDVYFRYGGDETPYILEKVNMTIESGQLIAIVGQSGSGKTTLAKLLVGFYEPNEGQITVDGYDMSVIDKETFRAQVGYVMQSNLLFSGSVADNIAAGDESPDRDRIVEVAKLGDAHGFIEGLPLGYEQTIGERGMGLSGGQMQRLCIARALYRDPKLVIFDEATSALDTQSEANILSNMQDILVGRTAVVIAHRLSTIMNADRIFVLYQGTIVEEGVHQELVDKQGMYFELVKKQIASAQ